MIFKVYIRAWGKFSFLWFTILGAQNIQNAFNQGLKNSYIVFRASGCPYVKRNNVFNAQGYGALCLKIIN